MARGSSPRRYKRITLLLNCLDLIDDKLEPIKLSRDSLLKIGQQQTSVSSSQGVEPLTAVSADRLITGNTLHDSKPLIRLACATRSVTNSRRSRHS